MMTHDELQNQLLEKIALDFEKKSMDEIKSDMHSYNDCAVIAKMWLYSASAVREYKSK